MIYYGFMILLIIQISLFSFFLTPAIFIYIIFHFIFIYVYDSICYVIYQIIDYTDISKYSIIKNSFLIKSSYNPIYKLYLKDKIINFKKNHIGKFIEIHTFSGRKYTGELKYVMDNIFVRISNSYLKYQIIKEIKLVSMYSDIYNYKILNLRNNFPKYIPDEINDQIESYIYSKESYKNNLAKQSLTYFSTTDEYFSVYLLYGSYVYAEIDY